MEHARIVRFIDAGIAGDLDAVKACIAQAGKDARELFAADNCTAFRWACINGNTEIASHLLTTAGELGGEVLQKELLTADDCLAFHWACRTGYTDTASHLLTTANAIDGLPLVNILSATVANQTELILTQQTAGAAIGDVLSLYAQKGIDSLHDALDAIPSELHDHIPNRRRLTLEAERKEHSAQEIPGRV